MKNSDERKQAAILQRAYTYEPYTEEAAEPIPILMLELGTSSVMIDDYIITP